MTDIEKQRANRLLVMKAIYDAWEGSEGNVVSGPDLLETLGLSDQELGDACKYLEGEHLIKGTRTLWGHLTPYIMNITHRGIREMEKSLQAPDEPTAYFPPAVSIIHVQGNLINSPIQSGSPGAQQELTAQDTKIEGAAEETGPSESKKALPWRLILMIAVAGLGAAVTAILGVSRLYWLSLALVVFTVGAVLAAVTSAITEEKHRTLALWISTGLCAALLIAIGIYDFIGPSQARTASVVANKVVDLSKEAGVSPTKEPFLDNNGNPVQFSSGDVATATCYWMGGGSIWLYFYFGPNSAGWAPFDDFHYQNGFPEQLPSRCH
jgi:hypothetical protein